MNCGAASGYKATQKIVSDLMQKKKIMGNTREIDGVPNLDFSYNNSVKEKINIKLLVLNGLKRFVITIFALAVVIGGYWLLYQIIS